MKLNIDKAIIKKLLNRAKKDAIQKIVVRAVVEQNSKFLLLKRAVAEFMGGLIVLPGGSVNIGEDPLQALAREVKEETNLTITAIIAYLGSFDYSSSSGKKIRQFNFFVEIRPGDIKIDLNEHSNYYLLNPSDEEFSKLNISDGTKTVLREAEARRINFTMEIPSE